MIRSVALVLCLVAIVAHCQTGDNLGDLIDSVFATGNGNTGVGYNPPKSGGLPGGQPGGLPGGQPGGLPGGQPGNNPNNTPRPLPNNPRPVPVGNVCVQP